MNNSDISNLKYQIKDNIITLPQEYNLNNEGDYELLKENLMFKFQKVSPFKLYFHIIGKLEIFLMIIAILATICSGCSSFLRAKLVGDNLDALIEFGVNWIYYLNDQQLEEVMDLCEKIVDKTNKKFIIYGAILFVIDFISIFLWFYIGQRLIHKMRINYFSLILKQEQAWFDQNNPFEFSSKTQAQLEGIEESLGDNPRFIILFGIEAIAGYIIGFIISWRITLVMAACSLPFIIGGNILTVCNLEEEKMNSLRKSERTGGIAEELLYNINTVTSFANFDYEINRYDESLNSKGGPESFLNPGIVVGIIMFWIFFGFSMALIYSRTLIGTNKQQTIGKIFTLLFSIEESNVSLHYLIPSFISIKEACILASDYFYLYERVPQIPFSEKDLKPNRESIKGNIEFKNVKFSYFNNINQNKKLILNGLNLSIEGGKMVAIVGESGSGKSTTVNLIERLYEPNEGEISLDGINIKDYNLEYLRDIIGFVKQEHFLFNKPIKQNIILNREESIKELGDIDTILEKACVEASIKNFIEKKVDKYEYNVGIQGNKLLPGQKQRLSIARAIFGQPKIIILDEATSFLDHESEKKILDTINNLNNKKITIIVIGYNYNILKKVDMIYVLKEGKIIEKGNHEELMANQGYYTGLIKNESQKKFMENEDINEKKRIKTLRNYTHNYTTFYGKTLMYKLRDEEEIKFNICKLFELISDQKVTLIIGTIAALFFGALIPTRYFILGKLATGFADNNNDNIKKGIVKWSLIFLLIVFIWVICDYFRTSKLGELGSNVSSKARKSLFQKYLELHMGFYDFESNNPSSLLSLLSIEANELGLFYSTIYQSVVATIGVIITALIIGFYYNWQLTLVIFCFFPIKILFSFLAGKFKFGGQRKNKEIRIEASNFFTNCVTESKTIFSYNFQQGAVDIYKSILDQELKGIIINNIFLSLFTSGIYFLSFASNSLAYKVGLKLIRHRKIKFQTIVKVRDTLMSYIDGIYFRIRGFWDYAKVRIAYKCIYSVLNTPSEINALEYANKDKSPAKELKGKIEFKNVSFSYPTKPTCKSIKKYFFCNSTWEACGYNWKFGKW